MYKLTYDQLPQGGFAGLKERQFVTDTKISGTNKSQLTAEGIGNFVYLADANFIPKGETGMHPHREIDVISVMTSGRIEHAGSLEHGQGLVAGMVQVQRAGGEGFRHNEFNPDNEANQMIQLWVLPDERGEPAGYKMYEPKSGQRLQVYGGGKNQNEHFYSKTIIEVAHLSAGQTLEQDGDVMAFLSKGNGIANGEPITKRTLVRDEGLSFTAESDVQLILIYENDATQ